MFVSYLEIYNENVNDLLDPTRKNLEIRESKLGDVFVEVEGLSEKKVTNEEDFEVCIQQGNFLRITTETKANRNHKRNSCLEKYEIARASV